jgi:hypothetical protein
VTDVLAQTLERLIDWVSELEDARRLWLESWQAQKRGTVDGESGEGRNWKALIQLRQITQSLASAINLQTASVHLCWLLKVMYCGPL